jgi:hypothetical protein
MNIQKKCKQIDSLLGDLSSTSIGVIPDIVYEMRGLLAKIEEAAKVNGVKTNVCGCRDGAKGIHANFCLFYTEAK